MNSFSFVFQQELLERKGLHLPDSFDYSPLSIDFTNMTVAEIAAGSTFPQIVQNATSIANSCFFLIVYSIICAITAYYFVKANNQMMKNQKILFWVMLSFVFTHSVALFFRLIYNSTGLHVNLNYSTIDKETLIGNLKLMWATAFLENVISFLQMIPFSCFIMSFILTIFLQTVEKAGAMGRKTSTLLFWLVMIVTVIAMFLAIALSVSNGIVNLLLKIQEIRFDVTPIYISLFALYLSIIATEIVLFLASGIRLVYIIRKNSLNASQIQHKNPLVSFMNRPYTKIIGLIVGILLCQLFAVLSIVSSIFTSLMNENLHIIDYFLHGAGVTLFSGFVLFCYAPYWSQDGAVMIHASSNPSTVELKGVSEPASPSPLLNRQSRVVEAQVTSPDTSQSVLTSTEEEKL